jgi:hypothetical protein
MANIKAMIAMNTVRSREELPGSSAEVGSNDITAPCHLFEACECDLKSLIEAKLYLYETA